MAIPVVTIPKQGPIATRPRRESLYDTDGWQNGVALTAKRSFFANASTFAATLSLSKIKGRDHNMDGTNGALPKGQMFHWYGIRNKIRTLTTNLGGAAALAIFDTIRQIKECCWWTFYFGSSTQYLQMQLWQIPEGVGIPNLTHTHNANTYVACQQTLSRTNNYDITLNGVPSEIGELETFGIDIESNGVTPTPLFELYNTCQLVGILFKGIQG